MKILFVYSQKIGQTTGSGVVALELARGLAKRGHSVCIICAEDSQVKDEYDSTNQIRFDYMRFLSSQHNDLHFPIVGMSNEMPYTSIRYSELHGPRLEQYCSAWTRKIRNLIESFQPDIVHVHHLWLLCHLTIQAAGNRPVVVSLHGTEFHRFDDSEHIRNLVCSTIDSCAKYFVLTANMKEKLSNYLKSDKKRIIVTGNGYSDEYFKPEYVEREKISFLNEVSSESKIITCVSKFARWKCIKELIAAYAAACKKTPHNLSCVIAGSGPRQMLRGYYEAATKSGVSDRVHFIGQRQQKELGALLNVTQVFVLPSYQEPYGLVLLEALGCGCLAVAADQGGPKEYVPNSMRDSRDVVFVPGLPRLTASLPQRLKYENGLADAIVEQCGKINSEKERKIRSRNVLHMSWNNYVLRMIEFYRDL